MAFTEFTPEKKAKFLKELAIMPNVSRAARLTGIHRRTAYYHYESDPDFKADWDDALEEGIEALEEHAWKDAKKGSDTLTIFLLKAHKPDKYRETVRNEHTGADGGPIPILITKMDMDAL